jgi:hypothetical protein
MSPIQFPPEFSAQAQARILIAKGKAERAFERAKKKGSAIETDIERYVMSVFAAYAHEYWEMAKAGTCTVSRIDEETMRFLQKLLIQTYDDVFDEDDYGTHSSGSSLYGLTRPDMMETVLRSCKALPGWKKCQTERRAVLKLHAAGAAAPNGTIVDKSPAGESKKSKPQFPNRATWLADQLRERSWNKHDPSRQSGPDHKTVQKILDGEFVRVDVLEKIADALSKNKGRVTVDDIPDD